MTSATFRGIATPVHYHLFVLSGDDHHLSDTMVHGLWNQEAWDPTYFRHASGLVLTAHALETLGAKRCEPVRYYEPFGGDSSGWVPLHASSARTNKQRGVRKNPVLLGTTLTAAPRYVPFSEVDTEEDK